MSTYSYQHVYDLTRQAGDLLYERHNREDPKSIDQAMKLLAEIEAELSVGISQEPRDGLLRMERGKARFEMSKFNRDTNRFAEAAADIRQALALGGSPADPWFGRDNANLILGSIAYYQGNYQEALRIANQQIAMEPMITTALGSDGSRTVRFQNRELLANVNEAMGRFDEALPDLSYCADQAALTFGKMGVSAGYFLRKAELELRMGLYPEAVRDFFLAGRYDEDNHNLKPLPASARWRDSPMMNPYTDTRLLQGLKVAIQQGGEKARAVCTDLMIKAQSLDGYKNNWLDETGLRDPSGSFQRGLDICLNNT